MLSERLLAAFTNLDANIVNAAQMSALNQLLERVPGEFYYEDNIHMFIFAALLLEMRGGVDDFIAASASTTGLGKHEIIWAALYPYLDRCGYALDDWYAPGWREDKTKPCATDEQGLTQRILAYRTVHATCRRSGKPVVLKLLRSQDGHPMAQEKEILEFLNTEPRRSHPHNPCVPILEFIDCPVVKDVFPSAPFSLVVMPKLQDMSCDAYCISGYSIGAFRQGLEGLAYLHSLGIAHRDICPRNVMVASEKRSSKVYFIDFGLATRFPLGESPLLTWTCGQIEPPEIKYSKAPHTVLYDPYKADVYMLARALSPCLWRVSLQTNEMVYNRMTRDDPKERPSAEEALRNFSDVARTNLRRRDFYRSEMYICLKFKQGSWKEALHNCWRLADASVRYSLTAKRTF